MELHEKEALVKNMDKLEPDKFGTALDIIRNVCLMAFIPTLFSQKSNFHMWVLA